MSYYPGPMLAAAVFKEKSEGNGCSLIKAIFIYYFILDF
jgi:hypothetical protein